VRVAALGRESRRDKHSARDSVVDERGRKRCERRPILIDQAKDAPLLLLRDPAFAPYGSTIRPVHEHWLQAIQGAREPRVVGLGGFEFASERQMRRRVGLWQEPE
jgi:hypothetical protein